MRRYSSTQTDSNDPKRSESCSLRAALVIYEKDNGKKTHARFLTSDRIIIVIDLYPDGSKNGPGVLGGTLCACCCHRNIEQCHEREKPPASEVFMILNLLTELVNMLKSEENSSARDFNHS